MYEFQNAKTLAHAVNNSLVAPFVPRPSNRFSPDESLWWLVGCSDWPAYKHGKLFFVSRPEQVPGHEGGIYCGFHLEKGLSRRVAGLYPKDLIEGDDWAWQRCAASLGAELPNLPLPQFVSVAVSYIPMETAPYDDSPDYFFARKESCEASQAEFALNTQQHLQLLRLVANQNCAMIAHHFETKIRAAADFGSLLGNLQILPQANWSWVDLYIGTVVSKGTVSKLWSNFLRPWSVWLGTSRPASQRSRTIA